MKLENKITAILMKENRTPVGCWEIKRTVGNTIPFSGFADHQIAFLMKAKHQRLNVKIKDVGVARKEFDGVTFEKSPAWCVCCYPSDKKHGFVSYSIDIDVWYNERRTSGKKSISSERASELGEEI